MLLRWLPLLERPEGEGPIGREEGECGGASWDVEAVVGRLLSGQFLDFKFAEPDRIAVVLEEDASCGIRREVLATFKFRFLDGLVPFVASHRDINDELAVEVMLQVLAPGHNFRSVPFADRIDLFLFVGRDGRRREPDIPDRGGFRRSL